MRIIFPKKITLNKTLKTVLWFALGGAIGLFFFASFFVIYYQHSYEQKIYPGIFIDNKDFGGMTTNDVSNYFKKKNTSIQNTVFVLQAENQVATISAKSLRLGYDANLLAQQAYSIGRSENLFSNISLLTQAYLNGVMLPPAYSYDDANLKKTIDPMKKKIDKPAVDALFQFENNKASAFRPSSDGKTLDAEAAKNMIVSKTPLLASGKATGTQVISIPVKISKPKTTTDEANDLGIKELVATGTSLFQGSIQNRIYNLTLASNRLNGILIAPDETFSFVKAVGDVSSLTGYKQAYVIQNGRTVLGDGGGLCQVSTTFFRAALNAGLPILERNPHAYRVHYYEEDSGPGIDAAVYTPTVDFKFKNDTGHTLLVQTSIDPEEMRLTFELYGTKDGREVTVNDPVILSTSPAPEPLFQDDPTLPKGQVKQVDFAAAGARVYFTREVKKDGKVLLADKFVSNYRPWQAVYMRGTKE